MALGIEKAIANHLVSEGFTNVNVGEEPDTPDSTISVFMDSGPPPRLTISETTRITIRTRDQNYEDCLETARGVNDELHENQGDFDGILVARITADFPPVLLGRDQGGRQGGRWRATQSFTVLSRRYTFF